MRSMVEGACRLGGRHDPQPDSARDDRLHRKIGRLIIAAPRCRNVLAWILGSSPRMTTGWTLLHSG